jgi:hypothetical protein
MLRTPAGPALMLTWVLALPPAASAQVTVGVHVSVPAVRVAGPPPPLRLETRPPAPSGQHVWVAGYWAWRGGRQVWIPGYWSLPPRPGYVWIEPRWVPRAVSGSSPTVTGVSRSRPRWSTNPPPPPPEPIIATVAPPPLIAEVRPPVPTPGFVWIPGFWSWTGAQYVWVAGRWSAPRPGFVWVTAHWRPVGHKGRYVPGHWRQV